MVWVDVSFSKGPFSGSIFMNFSVVHMILYLVTLTTVIEHGWHLICAGGAVTQSFSHIPKTPCFCIQNFPWHVDIKMDWTEVAMAKQPLGAGPYGPWSLRLPCRPGLPSAVLKIIVPKRKLTPGSHGTTWPWQDQCFVKVSFFCFFSFKTKQEGLQASSSTNPRQASTIGKLVGPQPRRSIVEREHVFGPPRNSVIVVNIWQLLVL